jgi:cytochrome c553
MIRIFTLAVCIPLLVHQAVGQTADAGKRQYQSRCVGCHGEDGTGGGHGPRIVDVPRPRAVSLEAVRNLILKGIADGGMPAFQISDAEADAIAAYVITLKAPAAGAATVPKAASGDAVAGERFFATRGIVQAVTWCAGVVACSVRTCRMWGTIARRHKSNRPCAILVRSRQLLSAEAGGEDAARRLSRP